MTTLVLLPPVSSKLPAPLQNSTTYHTQEATPPNTLAQAYAALPHCAAPQIIIGSAQTPALLWLAASQQWPEAQRVLAEELSGQWLDIDSGEYWPIKPHIPAAPIEKPQPFTPESIATPPNHLPHQTKPIVEPSSSPTAATPTVVKNHQPANSPSITTKTDHDLLFTIFRIATYEDSHDKQNQLQHCHAEVAKRANRNLSLPAKAKRKQYIGEIAKQLDQKVQQALPKSANEETCHSKIDELCLQAVTQFQLNNDEKKQIRQHLRHCSNKRVEWHQQQNRKWQVHHECSVPWVQLKGHPHPNSVRHLKPHSEWTILVDETGEEFEQTHLESNARKLGKVVALIVPKGTHLPVLATNFHAVSAPHHEIDKALSVILQSPVGVLGITTRDTLARRSPRWFTSIYHLLGLVLRLLPITQGQTTRVDVKIEQRGSISAGADMLAMQQLLDHELKSLDTERYGGLNLQIQVIDKDGDPLNGYVDTVAYIWGEKNRERLKRSAFLGHCFLTPEDDVIDRLFMAMDDIKPLSAPDWYRLAAQAGAEPTHSLAHDLLRQLSQRVRHDHSLWQHYLNEVRWHLIQKNYRIVDIAATLGWLQQAHPTATTALPPQLQLQWLTARLACANHLGHTDLALVSQCLALGQQLREEIAPEVCQAFLRIAVACTNSFDFASARPLLTLWQEQAPAVVGLSYYGKVLSSLGQIEAFEGRPSAAIILFEQALAIFERLSDVHDRLREAKQTQIYRLIALCDEPSTTARTLAKALENFWQQPLTEIAATLAESDHHRRFEQYLLLRVLIHYPELVDARIAYLQKQATWQEGEGHPWPLIEAWRGWLLLAHGHKEKAQHAFMMAINTCRDSDQGAILHWIAEVLAALAQSLGLEAPLPNPTRLDMVQTRLPHIPVAAVAQLALAPTHASQIRILNLCLPFNFH